MIRNLFLAALIAAFGAGAVYSLIQQWRVTPLIVASEAYEGGGAAHSHEAPAVAGTPDAVASPAHEHGEDEWAPQDGVERAAYTVLANVLAAAGFALILGAVSMFSGLPITFANGAVWGIAGFAAVQLAPSFGLPPALPGMPHADTFTRQIWWASTALATAGAILLAVKVRVGWALGVAVALVALPHIIGAPAAPDDISGVPGELATQFASASLVSGALLWLMLGLGFGYVNDRLAAREPTLAGKGALA